MDTKSIASQLPQAVVAFWRKPNGFDAWRVAKARESFVWNYALDAEAFPLLILDLKGGGNAPFSLAPYP